MMGKYYVTIPPPLENTARTAGADRFRGGDRYGDQPPVVGMHELAMTALAAARLDEAGGLQSANQPPQVTGEEPIGSLSRRQFWGRFGGGCGSQPVYEVGGSSTSSANHLNHTVTMV